MSWWESYPVGAENHGAPVFAVASHAVGDPHRSPPRSPRSLGRRDARSAMRCVYHDGLRYHQVDEVTDIYQTSRGLYVKTVAEGVPVWGLATEFRVVA